MILRVTLVAQISLEALAETTRLIGEMRRLRTLCVHLGDLSRAPALEYPRFGRFDKERDLQYN